MKQEKVIALPSWKETADIHQDSYCTVKDWEIIEIQIDDKPTRCLYGTVVSDYRGGFESGDYVFTSSIKYLDLHSGLVHTSNSVYCLQGDGEILSARLLEAYKMKSIGRSLHLVRAIERDVGTIMGPYN